MRFSISQHMGNWTYIFWRRFSKNPAFDIQKTKNIVLVCIVISIFLKSDIQKTSCAITPHFSAFDIQKTKNIVLVCIVISILKSDIQKTKNIVLVRSKLMTSSVSFFSLPFDDRFSLRHCPHLFSLLHCLFKEYCTCPQQVSFFFTWFLTKVLKCVEFKFLRPNYFCWFLLFHFFLDMIFNERVSSNQKRLTKVGWHAI